MILYLSDAWASVLTNLILLSPNKELNPTQTNSLISLSGLQHVDQTLN